MIDFFVTGLKWFFSILAASLLALAIIMAIIGRENTWAVLFGPPPLERIDFASLEANAKPNSFLLCFAEVCQNAPFDRESPQYEFPAERLSEIARKVIESTEGLRRDNRERDDLAQENATGAPLQWDYIATSQYLQFPDLITLRVVDLGGERSSLVIYGRAVYGYRDFGVNQNRIAAWIERIEETVALQK